METILDEKKIGEKISIGVQADNGEVGMFIASKEFRQLPIYKFAVEKGKIVDDQWLEEKEAVPCH